MVFSRGLVPEFFRTPPISVRRCRPAVTRARAKLPGDQEQTGKDELIVYVGGAGLATVSLLVAKFGVGTVQQLDAWNGIDGITTGTIAGAALWSIALYYASPLQLLLLFLGRIETERPSDWVLYKLGRQFELDVDAIDYQAPLGVRALMLACIAAGGIATAFAFQVLLEDATWSVSTGIGACIAGLVYETGRPDRLSVEEAQILEDQWQDFAMFADAALERRGRCHETEVFTAFRKRHGKYRTEDQLSSERLKDMVRNWNPAVARSRTGWYKNLSLKQVGVPDAMKRRQQQQQQRSSDSSLDKPNPKP